MSDSEQADSFNVEHSDQSSSDEEAGNSQKRRQSDGSEGFDSDDELQIAFKEGLLQKHGLNIPQPKKREPIYKKEEMIRKFARFQKKRDWLDTLKVKFSPDLCYRESVNKDFDREAAFYKQALSAVQLALPRLASMNVPTTRPADYFAEMAKSDHQMDRVRRKLLDIQKGKERQEQARRLREERKFAVKVQRSREEKKRKDKKKLLDATKKHRKGMKGQLEDMLKNAKRMQKMEEDEDEKPTKFGRKTGGRQKMGRKMGRTARDKKYGFGGQKKRSKRNDKKSFNQM